MPASPNSLRILAIEPWLGGSHQSFLESWREHSCHHIEVLGLPDRHWKVRMRDGARRLASKVAERAHSQAGAQRPPDLFWVSDYVDLPGFYGFLGAEWARVPALLYFHENQLTYPLSDSARTGPTQASGHNESVDFTFGYTNILSALRADRCVFNSNYHHKAFHEAARELLAQLPRGVPRGLFDAAMKKATSVAPGIDWSRIPLGSGPTVSEAPLCVAFNHRLEHDKCPQVFLQAVLNARQLSGCPIDVILLGERYQSTSETLQVLIEEVAGVGRNAQLGSLLHNGYCKERSEYLQLLGRADLIVSTAEHEFFGLSVLEGMAAGCQPLLPNRLSYPELLGNRTGPNQAQKLGLYESQKELVVKLAEAAQRAPSLRTPKATSEATEQREPFLERPFWRAVAKPWDLCQLSQELDEQCRLATEAQNPAGFPGQVF